MEWFSLVLLLCVSHLGSPRQLSEDVTWKQGGLNIERHTRECNGTHSAFKRIINHWHVTRRDEQHRQEVNPKQHNPKSSLSLVSARSRPPYQPGLTNSQNEGLPLRDTAHFMNHKSGNTILSVKNYFGRKTADVSNSRPLEAEHSQPIYNRHKRSYGAGSDHSENNDADQSTLTEFVTGMLQKTKLYYVRKIARLIRMYPELEKYPIPRTGGSRSISDKLKELSTMPVSELVHLLHSMMHHVNQTSSSGIHLHNICCDIG